MAAVEEETVQEEEEVFEQNQDLKVTVSYIYDNDPYVVVENVSDKPILDYSVAFLVFDKNGFTVDDWCQGEVSSANLMPEVRAYPVIMVVETVNMQRLWFQK